MSKKDTTAYLNKSGFYKLLLNSEYKKAEIWVKEFLREHPNDMTAKKAYAEILFHKGELKESLKIFNQIISDERSKNKILLSRIYLNFDLKRYLKVLTLIEEYERAITCSEYLKYTDFIKMYCQIKLSMEPTLPKGKENLYFTRQLLHYEDNVAINHIMHHASIETIKVGEGLFNENINITKLFYLIKENIPKFKRIYNSNSFAKYIVRYNDCGTVNGIKVNYLTVIAFPDSNQIVTMYPSTSKGIYDQSFVSDLNIENEEEIIQPKVNVKTINHLTQIEKFNKKYQNYKRQ